MTATQSPPPTPAPTPQPESAAGAAKPHVAPGPPPGHVHPLIVSLPYSIHERADKATADPQLQFFVTRATYYKDQTRKKVFAEVYGERYDQMRELAGNIKQHTLDYLDHYLGEWIDNAEANGVKVHYARDSAEANSICLEIAKANNCKLCVKAKSMVTEETHLLPELEAMGCETVETDLGEFILQIDHDAPSHIVTPMIHKDRVASAKALTAALGVPYNDEPEVIARVARDHLRGKYRKADLGISGGNFLVANTGSVVICTNEGNGRFCTSAPRIHVAFVGIEKVIPGPEHLSVMLKMLARSSTGQPLTVYTHTMTGPKRAHEHDGPEEMHVILIDNGRTEILRKETREMLRCIRCGACLNACPVYRKIGGHAYGAVYSGPIGALITPLFKGLANYKDLPQASSLCGACYEACPVKINIPKYLIQLRTDMVGGKITGLPDRIFYRVWAASLKHSLTYRLGGWAQTTFFRLQAKLSGTLAKGEKYSARGWLKDAPGPVKGWTSQRDMPTPPAASFRNWWDKEHVRSVNPKAAEALKASGAGEAKPAARQH
ncbi:MAG: LutB/LldF family L-lactate oxidation iron-sulfur protein [Planctomycetota bacterium]|nr:LutB/LldF family L-lactate oxidation iron-sulfur protein [Planctomycetota bacterium]